MSKAPISVIKVREANGNIRFAPADAYAEDQMHGLPFGERLDATVKIAKPGDEASEQAGLLRFFWAGINHGHANIEDPTREFPTPRHFRNHIFREIGFVIPIQRVDGVKYDPESISLDKLELADFKLVFEACRKFCVSAYGRDFWQEWADEHPRKDWK